MVVSVPQRATLVPFVEMLMHARKPFQASGEASLSGNSFSISVHGIEYCSGAQSGQAFTSPSMELVDERISHTEMIAWTRLPPIEEIVLTVSVDVEGSILTAVAPVYDVVGDPGLGLLSLK